MPRRTKEDAEKTRRALLTDGAKWFGEASYSAVSLEDLMKSMGITRGAVYHHFKNKRAFFEAVLEETQQTLGKKIERAAEASGAGWPGIEAGCLAFLGAATDPCYRQIVLVDGPAVLGWSRWKEIDDQHLTSALLEGLRELSAAGELSADAEALSVGLSGAMNELAHWVAHSAKPRSALRRSRVTVQAILRGLERVPD